MPGATKKRKRKQRGTQGGKVGARRSRPRNRAEAKAQARSRGRSKGSSSRTESIANRVGSPPTWRGAVNRALIASGIFLLLLVLLFGQPFPQALGLSAFMLLVYIPMGYYMDRFFYRMRMRKEQKKREEAKAEKQAAKEA